MSDVIVSEISIEWHNLNVSPIQRGFRKKVNNKPRAGY
jgi:hypothetical protein